MRKTKIVCTLGPASQSEEIMQQMLISGLDVARFNFSHNDHEGHKQMMQRFRKVRDELGKAAAIMMDTKGPEIRLGDFKDGSVNVNKGDAFMLTTQKILGDAQKASISYVDLPAQLKAGDRLLIDDGRVGMRVVCIEQDEIHLSVEQGGELKNNKGINIPKVHLNFPYLSEQDKADLLFGIEMDVDFVAASFVRTKEDVIDLRKFLDYHGGHAIMIIAKIENIEGVENFDEILANCNGIMVARGDMGVEVEYEKLPGIQKKFIKRCYQSGKMVITATQMLESMVTNYNPTRAEITDVANAVFDGTSAVMLSAESAAGMYPVRAVQVMARIAQQAEHDAFEMQSFRDIKYDMDFGDTTNAICDATCTTARDLSAKAIIAVTKYGNTARRMSKFRPFEPIVAATPLEKTFHQLSLSWGVYPVKAMRQTSNDELFLHAIDCAKQIDVVADGDIVVITAGVPLDTAGSTNILKVERVGSKTFM